MSIEIKNEYIIQWTVTDNSNPYRGIIRLSKEEFDAMSDDDLLAKQTEEYNKAIEARKTIAAEQPTTDTTTV